MSGREEELVDEMQKYGLDVLGVGKAKVKGNAAKCTGNVTCVFLGVQDGRAKTGWGFCPCVPSSLTMRLQGRDLSWWLQEQRVHPSGTGQSRRL